MKNLKNRAVLLVNLGSPDSPEVPDVRKYLNQFLMDGYVIQLPWLLRRLIVSLFVLPKRPVSSAEAYKSVWTDRGSPLIALSEDLLAEVSKQTNVTVRLAMRYGKPDMETEIKSLNAQGIDEFLLLPLYPHYAESTVTTCIAEAERIINDNKLDIELKTLPVFYNDADYINALTDSASPWLEQPFDHILFSYHGLPEQHLTKIDPTGCHCLKTENCCSVPSPAHATCYRHQVMETTRLFVEKMKLDADKYSVAFQSRLGRAKWLDPYTSEEVVKLAEQGVKNLLVICPAFVTDCLETLEEIEMEADEIFREAGGDKLTLIPCMNSSPAWTGLLASWCDNFAQNEEMKS